VVTGPASFQHPGESADNGAGISAGELHRDPRAEEETEKKRTEGMCSLFDQSEILSSLAMILGHDYIQLQECTANWHRACWWAAERCGHAPARN
jgi:hypothetical protein